LRRPQLILGTAASDLGVMIRQCCHCPTKALRDNDALTPPSPHSNPNPLEGLDGQLDPRQRIPEVRRCCNRRRDPELRQNDVAKRSGWHCEELEVIEERKRRGWGIWPAHTRLSHERPWDGNAVYDAPARNEGRLGGVVRQRSRRQIACGY